MKTRPIIGAIAIAALALTASPAGASPAHSLKAERAEWKAVNAQFDRAAGPANQRLKTDGLPQLLADYQTIGLALRQTEDPLANYRWSPKVAKDVRTLVADSDAFSHVLVKSDTLPGLLQMRAAGYFNTDGTAVVRDSNAIDSDLGVHTS